MKTRLHIRVFLNGFTIGIACFLFCSCSEINEPDVPGNYMATNHSFIKSLKLNFNHTSSLVTHEDIVISGKWKLSYDAHPSSAYIILYDENNTNLVNRALPIYKKGNCIIIEESEDLNVRFIKESELRN